MAYSHQTPNLRESLGKGALISHITALRQEFSSHKITGYSMPDGVNWEKHVSKMSYNLEPVEGNTAIAISLGAKAGEEYHHRLCTLYPKLGLAVLDSNFRIRSIGSVASTRIWATAKLERLGYSVAKKASCFDFSGKPLIRPYHIAAEESNVYRNIEVCSQVIRNLNAAIKFRPQTDHCELAVFSPPGDGGGNSPIGRFKVEIDYGLPKLNIARKIIIPIKNGEIDAEVFTKIFNSLTSKETIGITSRIWSTIESEAIAIPRQVGLLWDQTEYGSLCPKPKTAITMIEYHIPMLDFKCTTPEEAIHTIERMGIKITNQKVVIIDSGKSFHAHFPTEMLKSEEDARKFLHDLKRHEEVCEKWIPLQQQQNYQLLRVAPCIQKPKLPVVLEL